MIFRNSTCKLCGKVPPSMGFEELPGEQQGRPVEPTQDEMTRLWEQRTSRIARCPRCYRTVGMHLLRIAANRQLLGTANDTALARQLKVPVVMIRNVRGALGIAGQSRRNAGQGGKLSPEQLAIYRNGALCNICAARAAGVSRVSVRVWRARHLDMLECPKAPDPIPPEFFDPGLSDSVVADLTGCTSGTVWKWRRQHRDQLRPLREDVRERIRARHREWAHFSGRRSRRHCNP
jgi:hypothetical protein